MPSPAASQTPPPPANAAAPRRRGPHHPQSPTHGQCRPRRRGRLRRISPPQRRNKLASYPNRAEFSRIPRFFPGLRLGKNTSRAESVKKSTSAHTGGFSLRERSAGLHRPAFQAGRGTLPWHEMPAGISASPYRLFPKSARNFLTSLSCQSLVGSRRPKKKRRLLGSSTQRRPPTSSRFSKSHVMRSTA